MTQRPDLIHGLDSPEQFFDAHRDDPEILDAFLAELDGRADPRADDVRRRLAALRAEADPADRLFDELRNSFARPPAVDLLVDDSRLPDSEAVLRFPNEAPDDVWRKLAIDGETLDLAPQAEPRLVSADERREALRAALDLHRPAPRLEAAPPAELFLTRLRSGRGGRRLQTGLPAPALSHRLETIADEATLYEQETGRTALYLIFGVLEWRAPETPETRRLAPLLFLPVHLDRRNEHGRSAYALAAATEAAERNSALLRAFEARFNHGLPEFLPDPESITPISAWFDAIDAAVSDLDGFAVRRFVTLAALRTGRRALYDDLDPRRFPQTPASHPLTGPILRGIAEPRAATTHPDHAPIDDADSEATSPLLVYGADSIEHAVLADAAAGRNPVILAPPGTAGMQTVANIVADTMARGKTVLVLAEKQAALDSVKQRLDEAGLGIFCLEAHGRKAAPRAILRSLRERMSPQIPRSAPPRPDLAARDAAAKDLAAYASALHAVQDDGETAFSLIWRFVAGSAQHGSSTRAFRGIEIPPRFLHDPAETARAGQELARHAEAAIRFESLHGSAHTTPWSRLDPGVLSTEAAASILEHLEEAHRAALELADLFRQTADFGLSGLKDLTEAIAAPLPEVQDLSAVGRVSGLDLDALEQAISLRRAILACERDLEPAASLMALDDSVLVQAAEVAAAARTCAFSEVPPAEAYSRAENEMRDAQQLAAAMSGLIGTMSLLGFDEEAESRLLMGVAAAVSIAASIPPALRRWLAWEPAGPQERFERVAARGKALGDAEAEWRQDIPGYDSAARPKPDDLRAAAAALRRAGMKRLFSSISGDLKTARALCESLGLHDLDEDRPALLESLAAHVEAANAFDVDEKAAQAIGPAWAGVDTPFGVMSGALRVRNAIRDGLADYFCGAEIADRMLRLDERGATEFGAFAPAAMVFRSIPGARTLGRENVRTSVRRYEEAIVRLTAFVGRDPDGAFSPLMLPIERVAVLADRELQRRGFAAELARNPVADVLEAADLDALADAIAWLRGVADLRLPAPLKDALTSVTAAEMRRRLLGLGQRAGDPLRRLTAAMQTLSEQYGLSQIASDDAETIARQASDFLRSGEALPDFLRMQVRRSSLERVGLGPFVARAEESRVRPEEIGAVFSHLALRRRIEALRLDHPALARSGAALEARRRAFADQDRAKMEKDRAGLRSLLFTMAHDSDRARSGMRHLEREIRRDRGLADLRWLMQEAGPAVQVLKPCILASPLTLAEHVPADVAFDLIVIAEASQMPIDLALGGLMRARTMVAIGDPAGLPPRDFLAEQDESETAPAGRVSVLEATAAAFGRRRQLVRRKGGHGESLLAFSNRIVYGDSIALLPEPRPEAFGIDLVRVDGEASEGRNEAEARCIAAEAFGFMRRFVDSDEDALPTLGVVAATAAQADLIRTTLRTLEDGDERAIRYREKAARRGEPFFVKSLETVQGDRRDCILASLVHGKAAASGTGPDRLGAFSRRHGERRVHVLATRARVKLGLVTSLGAADLECNDASPAGEHLLSAWLAYAETRGRMPDAPVRGHVPGAASRLPVIFEAELTARLRARGYEVVSGIGLTGTDALLGVRHGARPGLWLAGIEADGATHRVATNARDRDRLRDEALRALGWDVLRVWSTDWFDDPDLQANRLMIQLEGLRRKEPVAIEDFFRFDAPYPEPSPVVEAPEPLPLREATPERRDGETAA